MKYYNQYVVTKRFKNKALCGNLNLPYGTKCYAKDGIIYCNKGAICNVSSQNAYDFFSQNDDGQGFLRMKLVQVIQHTLAKKGTNHQKRWDKVWDDEICQKYKREECGDYWLWNYDFFNADIDTLKYIANLVGAKVVK